MNNKKFCMFCHVKDFTKNNAWKAVENQVNKGNFSSLLQHRPPLTNLQGVQCKMCHGSGSQHAGLTDQNRISKSMSPGVCAVCHESEEGESKLFQWTHSSHAKSMSTPRQRKKENQPGCDHCHTAQGY